jgi:O-antigen/teichoic acid export membrane protein
VLNRVLKNSLNRNFLILFSGTALAQSIPVAISPILTRLYTPSDFGIFTLYFSIATLFSIVSTGRYELAIMLPKEDEEAKDIAKLCYVIALIISSLIFIIVFFSNELLTALLGNKEIGNWLYLLPVSVFFTAIFQTISYQLNREKNYIKLSGAKIVQTTAVSGGNISMGFFRLTTNGLISGHILGQIISSGVLHFKNNSKLFRNFNHISIMMMARKYKNFILFNTPTAMLDRLSTSIPIFFLGNKFDKEMVGFYGLIERIIGGPVSLVSYSISQVLFQSLTEKINNNVSIYPEIRSTLKKLILIGIVPFTLLYFFSDDIFVLVFGDNWRFAGNLASYFSIVFFVRFVVSPLSMVFIAKSELKTLVKWQILYFISTIIVVIISYFQRSIIFFVIAYTISEILNYLFYLFLIIKVSKKDYVRY